MTDQLEPPDWAVQPGEFLGQFKIVNTTIDVSGSQSGVLLPPDRNRWNWVYPINPFSTVYVAPFPISDDSWSFSDVTSGAVWMLWSRWGAINCQEWYYWHSGGASSLNVAEVLYNPKGQF